MKFLIILLSISFVCSVSIREEWENYKTQFNKRYSTKFEEYFRRVIFERNLRRINNHNLEAQNGLHTFTMGLNQLSDQNILEVRAERNGFLPGRGYFDSYREFTYNEKDLKNLPETVDWREKGYVTDVKDQGACGSCWAFSAVASIEGQHKNVTGQLVSLSEQQLVDCSFLTYGNLGCLGGQMDNAFKYVIDKGSDTEASYPYTAKYFEACKSNSAVVVAKIKSFVDLPQADEIALQVAVATVGPISVAIDAGHDSFQHYKSGVYYEPQCSSTTLDHGVTVVGYGTDNGSDYWLVKNSWNTSWGDKGYIKMARNRNNHCGIASRASYPIAIPN